MKVGNIVFSVLLCCLCSTVATADEAQARQLVQQARNQYDAENMYAQERAFELFYDAYGEATTYSLRSEIADELVTVYRNYTAFVKNRVPPFLDDCDDDKASLYRKLADYKDSRGKRLLGLTQLHQGDISGLTLVSQAAAEGDAEAAYLMAEAVSRGIGVARNAETAYRWLEIAAERGYAPACERLAAIHWDGDPNWNAAWNQSSAASYLDKAIELYTQFSNLSNPVTKKELQDYISSLRLIRENMQSFIGYNTGNVLQGFYPSFLALRLSTYNEQEGGLRVRAYYIKQELRRYGGTYHISGLPDLDLSLIPIRLSYYEPEYVGHATTSYSPDDSICLQIDVHAENYAYANNESSRWRREIGINGTIAHEMAHCFLRSKYYSIFNGNYPYYKQLVEGHATNVEYAFVNHTYFDGEMASETFAGSWCSSEYGNYFRWYRSHCLLPKGSTNWSVIEQHERAASPTGEGGKVRKLISGPDGTFRAPLFFR